MQKTRQDILEYLSDHPRAAASEIARYLDLTPANIRYHLDILIKEGTIQISGERKAGHAGRPILLYNVSSNTLGDNFPHLAKCLLTVVMDNPETDLNLQKIAGAFLENIERQPTRGIKLFNQAIAILDQFNYRASWKATRVGPQVELKHCPYQDLAREDPRICQVDEAILSELLETRMVLVKRRDFGPDPFSPCVFHQQVKS